MSPRTLNRLKFLAMLVLILPMLIVMGLSYFVTSETSDSLLLHYEKVQVGAPVNQMTNSFLLDEMQYMETPSKVGPIHYYAEREEGWLPGARIGLTFDASGKVASKKLIHPGAIAICQHWVEKLGW